MAILHRKWTVILATAITTILFLMLIYKPAPNYPVTYEKHSIFLPKPYQKTHYLENWRHLTKNEVKTYKRALIVE